MLQSAEITGNLILDEGFEAFGCVWLAEARIDGEVQAAHIVVNGVINGPVQSTETLELQAGSKVKGDVHYNSIEITRARWSKGGWCITAPRRRA